MLQATKLGKKRQPPWLTGMQRVLEQAEVVNSAIEFALREDIGTGDITCASLVPPDQSIVASVVYKEPGIVAGLDIMAQIFSRVNSAIQITRFVADGQFCQAVPTTVAIVRGPASGILTGERTALNFLQRMSAVATTTRRFVELAKPHNIVILDTRKTTPGLRAFEKCAVCLAGGFNHRFGLYDQILIKDNHLKIAGGVPEAIRLARLNNETAWIEVEVTNLSEVSEAVKAKADHIMLDNMTPDMVQEAVNQIADNAWIEVSGGINLQTISDYFIAGVDAISVGSLTHSAGSIDISLEVEF